VSASISASIYGGDPAPALYNIARACLSEHRKQTPDKVAFVVAHDPDDPGSDEIWTYADLEDAVLRLASALSGLGVTRGDRVMLRLGNSSTLAMLFLAATAIGAVAIPLSSQLTGDDIAFMASDTEPELIVVAPGLPIGNAAETSRILAEAQVLVRAQMAVPVDYADTAADDPAYLVYTSGATSRPKGVVHAHRALWGRRPMYEDWYGISSEDVVLHAGTLNWTYTLGTGFLDPLANGATSVVYSGDRTGGIWPGLIERFGATLFAGVPTVFRQIVKYAPLSPERMPTLRHGLAAGEPLPKAVADDWFASTGRQILEAFGMSEISTYISTPSTDLPRSGSPGRPQAGRAVAILPEDGSTEPVGRGETGFLSVHRSDPGLMVGYWNRPDEDPFRGDWFVTGDLASMDADCFIWPKGRGDDVMKILGYRVSAAEVEAALVAAPGVAEAAAIAVEARPGVSIIRAFVVGSGENRLDPENLREFAKQHLAAYKVPHEIVVVGALPRTSNGKIQRARLRDS